MPKILSASVIGFVLLLTFWACKDESPKPKQERVNSDIVVLASNLGYVGGITADNDKFYISSWSSPKAGAKEGQGKILQLDTGGRILSGDFLPQVLLHAPKGLFVRNSRLYIADIDSIKVVDLVNRQLLRAECVDFRNEVRTKISRVNNGKLLFQGSELYPGLADLVAGGDSNIFFVAVMNSGNIYRIESHNKKRRLLASTPFANSLCYHRGTLYANGFTTGNTTVKILNADSIFKVEAFPIQWTTQGGLDALCIWQDKLLFADWGAEYLQNGQLQRSGVILQAEISDGKVTRLPYAGEPKFFAGPTAIIAQEHEIYLLSFAQGTLYRIKAR